MASNKEWFQKFEKIKGYTFDLYYNKIPLRYSFHGNQKKVFWLIAKKIRVFFLNNQQIEDLIVYGSLTYNGLRSNSDIDLIGINRLLKRNKLYSFKVINQGRVIPITLRVENGKDNYHSKFVYKKFSGDSSSFILDDLPKCYGVNIKNVFSKKSSLMVDSAKSNILECLAMILQVLFSKTENKEIRVTPEILVDKLKEEFYKTKIKRLFVNNRWERGLRNCWITNLQWALNYGKFWISKNNDGSFTAHLENGLRRDKRGYSLIKTFFKSINPYYLLYRRDQKKFDFLVSSF